MIDNIATRLATLDDDKAREFIFFHFEVEESRLIAHGISDPEIDRYIFETARAIWSRMRKIKAGAA